MTLTLSHRTDETHILHDGRPLTTYRTAESLYKPHFWPVIGPYGDPLTRAFPNASNVPEEMHDHPHHRGLHFTHGEIAFDNEPYVDFWIESAGDKQGRIVHRAFERGPNAAGNEVSFTSLNDWLAPDGRVMLTERASWRITDLGLGNILFAFRTALSPAAPINILDTKEGSFSIRVPTCMDEQLDAQGPRAELPRGVITSSNGARTEKECWGKPADWVDYSGVVNAKPVGIAMFDHPDNQPHARWHVRAYGLFAANPFGLRCFNPNDPPFKLRLTPGETLTLRYGVLFHPGDTHKADIPKHYTNFLATWS